MHKRNYHLLLFLVFTTLLPAQETKLNYLALGDSYTDATSEIRKNGWPQQLINYLEKKDISFDQPTIVAGPGWTTAKLLQEMDTLDLEPPYDLVSLMIGVNNQYRGLSIDSFKEELIVLIDRSIVMAGNDPEKVFLVSIPDWGVTPFAKLKNASKIAKDIAQFNSVIEAEAKKRNLTYINVTSSSKNMEVNKNLIASDSLHPSKKMYQIWAKRISKVLLKNKSF